MTPRLSVVVPFHDVEGHLAECLASLERQTLRDLEVIMVDDGSADGGAVTAKQAAAGDARFRLVQQRRQGPGAARAAGLAQARGEYLAFVDGDDTVVPHAFERLVGSLEETGSDLACGRIRRVRPGAGRSSAAFAGAFGRKAATRTHVTRDPLLLADRTVCGKVYRRALWETHGLRFADGPHEAFAVAVAAHLRAAAVDVLDLTVCHWHGRPGDAQERIETPEALDGRLTAAQAVHDLLAADAPQLLGDFHQGPFTGDLMTLVNALPKLEEADRERLARRGRELVALADPDHLRRLPAFTRLCLHLLGRGMLAELTEVASPFDRARRKGAPTVRRGLLRPRWYARFPYFEDAARGVPDEVYDVTDELRLCGRVDGTGWRDGSLLVEGHAYIGRVDLSAADDARIRVWLHDAKRNVRLELPVKRTLRRDVTAAAGTHATGYDWSGFEVRVDPDALLPGGRRRAVDWTLHAEVSVRGLRRAGPLAGPVAPQARWAAAREIADGVWARPAAGADHFELRIRRPRAVAVAHRVVDGVLEIDARGGGKQPGPVAVTAVSREGRGELHGTAECAPRPGGGFDLRARLPLAGLPAEVPAAGREGACGWDILVTGGDEPFKLMVAEPFAETRHLVAGREFVVTRTRFGSLCAVERPPRPTVTAAEWRAGNRLVLSGDLPDGTEERPDRLTLRHTRYNEHHDVPLSWTGDRFTAAITPAAMPVFGTAGPLAAGDWDLVVGAPDGERALVVDRTAIATLPTGCVVGGQEVTPRLCQVDELQLRVRAALTDDERGARAQERLRREHYPAQRRLPARDIVVLDSYRGRQYSCSPRMVHEELRRRGGDLDCVWVSRDGHFTAPLGARTVLADSRAHYEALARARYVLSNEAQPTWFVKRPDQVYVQTWHGTPLKRLGLDVPAPPHLRRATERWVEQEVTKWDVLVSPSPFASPIMRRAYRYEGEILESGYPRNDLLLRPDRDRLAADVRRRLGIPAGKRVVLYVPTWRDNLYAGPGRRGFEMALDLDRAARTLGGDHVLLLRTHYLVTDRITPRADGTVLDVSRYPDVADLYLIADVLVTDYSSAMFDFAVTGRPMVFFTYDLELYRDRVRGFYFDFEAEAPGPLLRTSDEVLEALRGIEDVARERREAYAAFVERFCPFDDGRAAARVVDRFLELGGA